MSMSANAIFQADCLAVLQRLESGSVTLTYLDPPYELYDPELGDTPEPQPPGEHLQYLSLIVHQVRRVLSADGSVFFCTDPRYIGRIQVLFDYIFGSDQFRTHIILPRRMVRARARPLPTHDTIIVYSKSDRFVHNPQHRPLSEAETHRQYPLSDDSGPYRLEQLTRLVTSSGRQNEWKGYALPEGQAWRYPAEVLEELDKEGSICFSEHGRPRLKRYLADSTGIEVGSLWDDISRVQSARERLASPAQPLAAVERIVRMASNPGDLVLDPFCGTGTILVAAFANKRLWIGVDRREEVLELAIQRLGGTFDLEPGTDFYVGDQDTLEATFPVLAHPISLRVPDLVDVLLRPRHLYLLNQPLPIEETRHYEFKEVKGGNPIRSITSVVDEYVVAFLNTEGGRIFWGVRNEDRMVVGVRLDYPTRDELRRIITDKLGNIQPRIDPTAYRVELHQVYDGRVPVKDCFVVEVVTPRVGTRDVFYTGSGELFVKTDAGKKRLTGTDQTDFIVRRMVRAG